MENAATNLVIAVIATLTYFLWSAEFTAINLGVIFVTCYMTTTLISSVTLYTKEIKS